MLTMRGLLGAFLGMALVCAASSAQSSASKEEQAVRATVAEYMKARNTHDANAMRRLFTPEADQLVSTGEWRKGVAALIRGMSASSNKEAPSSSIQVEAVRFLDSDVALADGRYRTVSLGGATREMWTTIVLKRVGQDWRIAAIRNMLPAPPH